MANKLRTAAAWALYGIGHAISVVFDRWLPWGMSGPIYGAYNGVMLASSKVQRRAPGPWSF